MLRKIWYYSNIVAWSKNLFFQRPTISEGFSSWMFKGLSFLLPFLLLAYIFQFYNSYFLYTTWRDYGCKGEEWQVRFQFLLYRNLNFARLNTLATFRWSQFVYRFSWSPVATRSLYWWYLYINGSKAACTQHRWDLRRNTVLNQFQN